MPGDATTSPLPLGDRIVIALDQDDPAKELTWQTRLDWLLDRYPRQAS